MTRPDHLERIRAELARRARVFEDPEAYLDGVDDALTRVRAARDLEVPDRAGGDRRPRERSGTEERVR